MPIVGPKGPLEPKRGLGKINPVEPTELPNLPSPEEFTELRNLPSPERIHRLSGLSPDKQEQGNVVSYGEEYQGKVTSYSQQLKYELGLRGLEAEELANKIGVEVQVVKEWETNSLKLNRADRRKLIEFLGRNDYYLSSEVFDNGDLRVRVVQLELTARDFTTIISALTEFHTEFWLIQQGRFPDLEEYTQTQDSRFMEEANLVIDNLTTNSPTLLTLLTDPGTATTAVTTIVTLAVALQKAIDVITQTWKKIQEINQGNQERKLEIQRKQFELEQEQLKAKREQFEWEEEQVKRKQKLIESSIPKVVGVANTLHQGIDEQTREIIMQAMTLTCWKLLDRE